MPHYRVTAWNKATGLLVELGRVEASGPALARNRIDYDRKYDRSPWIVRADRVAMVFPKRPE
jgi:hypothetical protein